QGASSSHILVSSRRRTGAGACRQGGGASTAPAAASAGRPSLPCALDGPIRDMGSHARGSWPAGSRTSRARPGNVVRVRPFPAAGIAGRPLPRPLRTVPMQALATDDRHWPNEGISRVPGWVYSAPDVFAREQERIFKGRSWCYVCLEAEIPNAGDFRRSYIGGKVVLAVRRKDGGVSVVLNRCAHRGAEFCSAKRGNKQEFVCPYHEWTYDLEGNLIGVPVRRGYQKQGGMPADFKPEENGLVKLEVASRHGVVFASFDHDIESFEDYLGEKMLGYFDRVFDGRKLTILGYERQRIPANWKLMMENIKDPYHASLLHVFLVSFGLFRMDQKSQVQMDPTGRHCVLVNRKGEQS